VRFRSGARRPTITPPLPGTSFQETLRALTARGLEFRLIWFLIFFGPGVGGVALLWCFFFGFFLVWYTSSVVQGGSVVFFRSPLPPQQHHGPFAAFDTTTSARSHPPFRTAVPTPLRYERLCLSEPLSPNRLQYFFFFLGGDTRNRICTPPPFRKVSLIFLHIPFLAGYHRQIG